MALQPLKAVRNITSFCSAVWLFREFVVDIQIGSGPSMYPTLPFSPSRSYILRSFRLGRNLQVGDVIIYRSPIHADSDAGKRVIGMPGDYVCADAPYASDVGRSGNMVQVPEGHVWVAGDNLPWSRDSRYYGPVPMGLIRGKYWFWTQGFGFSPQRIEQGTQALKKVEKERRS